MDLVTNKVVIDIFSGKVLFHDFDPEYIGDWVWLKKGRDTAQQAASGEKAVAATNTAVQNTARDTAAPFENSLLATKPGQLSPYAKAQYDSDVANINDQYAKANQVGLKQIAARGFGNAPTGATSSLNNTLLEDSARERSGAYRTALGNTYNEGVQGAGYQAGLQQIYNPLPAYQSLNTTAGLQNKMGSTFGDVATGLGAIAKGFANG